MTESIFTKIIRGELPSYKLYEDDKTLAFLDIHPVQPGHTLVIPKTQVEFVWDLSEDDYHAVMATAKKVANRLKQVLATEYIGEQIVGVDVPHAHVHLIPFNSLTEFRNLPSLVTEPDYPALSAMAQRLRFAGLPK